MKIDTSKLNSRVLEALIKSGVFDSLEPNRKKILEGAEQILSLANAEKSMNRKNQTSFFDLLSSEETKKSKTEIELPDIADWRSKTRLKFEKEALGFYISGHPLNPYFNEIKSFAKITRTIDLKSENLKFNRRETINISGVITVKIVRLTKKTNEKWAALTIEDLWGSVEVMVFSKVFSASASILDTEEFNEPVLITGYLNHNDETVKIVAQAITSLPAIREERAESIFVNLPENYDPIKLTAVKDIIQNYPGDCSVKLSLTTNNDCKVQLSLLEKVCASEDFVNEIEELLPLECLTFEYKSDKTHSNPVGLN